MQIESLIRKLYKNYLSAHAQDKSACLDDEALASFCEGLLNEAQSRKIEAHLAICDRCAETAALYNRVKLEYKHNVPPPLTEKAGVILQQCSGMGILEVILGIKEKALELLNTTGNIIRDNEIMPLPVLRSRGIREFKEEIVLVKEFAGIKIILNIEKKNKDRVKINVILSDRKTHRPATDLRVALFKDNAELESYLAKSGVVIFEGLTFGAYILEISRHESRIGIIRVEIR